MRKNWLSQLPGCWENLGSRQFGVLVFIFPVLLLFPPTAKADDESLDLGGIKWRIHEIHLGGEIHYDNSLLVVDGQGHPHLFFSGAKKVSDRNVIFYVMPEQAAQEPLDILLTTKGGWSGVVLLNARYDPTTDSIFLLWTTKWGGDLVLSRASVGETYDARNWQSTVITSDVITGDFIVDSAGVLHVTYGTFEGGVIEYTYSMDLGNSWSVSAGIFWLTNPDDSAFTHLRLLQDNIGNLHLTWSENMPNAVGVWQPRLVWHAVVAQLQGEMIGTAEVVLDQGREGATDYLSLWLESNGNRFVRIVNLGAGSSPGRYQQWYEGAQWGALTPILPGESGLGGYSRFFEDSTGRVYMISSAQMPQAGWSGIALRLYLLEGQDWTLQGILARCEFHNVSVFQGNQVHLACRLSDGLLYIRGDIPVPASTMLAPNSVKPALARSSDSLRSIGTLPSVDSEAFTTTARTTYLKTTNLVKLSRTKVITQEGTTGIITSLAASSMVVMLVIMLRQWRVARKK